MIITNDFVLLLLPKTGTSFANVVIRYSYWRDGQRCVRHLSDNLLNPSIGEDHRYPTTQHGFYMQIPEEFRHLPVYSILRNLYRLLISEYGYIRWQVDWLARDEALRQFPDFPNLGFARFLDFSSHIVTQRLRLIHHNPAPPDRLGMHSYRFLYMFCRDPQRVFGRLTEDYIQSGEWLEDLCPVRFLQQHRLRDDLRILLSRFGFPEERLEFIADSPARLVNPSVEFDPSSGGWKVGMTDILKFLEKREKQAEESGEAAKPIDLKPFQETILPDDALLERIRHDERILFRFIEETPELDAARLTAWPQPD